MQKLQSAIEKAKQDDGFQEQQTLAANNANTAKVEVEHDLQQISYTQTKTHALSSFELEKNRVLSGREAEPVRTAYNLLRTQVLQKMKANNWNSLAVVSANTGEGRSLTATNLAISLAQEVNHSVLLADFDMRKPSLHQLFNYPVEKGLSDYLQGNAELSEVLFNPGINRLVVLPGREAHSNSSSLLTTPNMLALVDDIKNRYQARMLVFDLPALLDSDDALVFMPYVDAVLLVVGEGKSSEKDLSSLAHLIGDKPVLGTVFNASREIKA